MPNNMQLNEAVHSALLSTSVVPPPLMPQWAGKLASEPVNLSSLRSKDADFYEVS